MIFSSSLPQYSRRDSIRPRVMAEFESLTDNESEGGKRYLRKTILGACMVMHVRPGADLSEVVRRAASTL